MSYFKLLKPFLYRLDPETAHNFAIFALRNNLLPTIKPELSPVLESEVMGIKFNNPVGLAAGFDKNADAIPALLRQGFGFIEVGTVTPKPQEGNPKPRLFRLEEDSAVINRFGFNNKGIEHFLKNLEERPKNLIVGANIGKNKTTENALDDYLILLERIYGLSDYITINISSPNTPGLRDLQNKDCLDGLLEGLTDKKKSLQKKSGVNVPLLLKIAPDIDKKQINTIAGSIIKYKIDGIIVSNTTIGKRDGLKGKNASEQGGLSGKPLFELSNDILREIYKATKGVIPIIGVGGIFSAADAYSKIRSGASLVQVYSGLIYEGFGLVRQINHGLASLLEKDGFANISEAVGADSR